MSITRICRVTVCLASLLFAGVAMALWAAPEEAARVLGIETIRAAGVAMVRADLGGLFAGMSVLCAAAVRTRRQAWAYAAAIVLAAIVIGRPLGWIAGTGVGSDLPSFLIELGVIAALIRIAQDSTPAEADARHRGWRRPAAITTALLIVPALSGAAALLNPAVQQRIFDRGAEHKASTINAAPLQDDALRVAVCGSSAPLPSAPRAKACVAVFAAGKFYIVDVGPESVENLVLWGIPLSSIGGVLLTHFHSDHIGDLGELNLQTWAGGRPAPLAVYGGPGVERIVEGFNDAYRLDQGYRTAHHTDRVMPPATWPMIPHTVELEGAETPKKDRRARVLEEGGLRITAFEVDHAPIAPAYAYRFDYKGRSVLVTGDLKFHQPLVAAARDVDLMVSEAISVSMTRALGTGASSAGRDRTAAIMHDIEDYHITPEQAAQIANQARVTLLAFYHLLPAPDGVLARRLFAQGIDEVRRGDWTLAEDGSLYTMPIGSKEVQIGHVVD